MTVQPTRCFFRADGNSEIGWGHVVRSLALATIVKQKFECVFAIQEPSAHLSRQITESGCQLIVLPASDYIKEAHSLFKEHIQPKDIIVLDGYKFTTEYQRILKQKNNLIVCIDDLSSFHFLADAIINPAGNVKHASYSKEPYTKLYTGPRYALLREPFLEKARHKNSHYNFGKILISMGGADPENYTSRVLQQILPFHYQEIHIVIGSAYIHTVSLEKTILHNSSVFLHTNLSAEEMSLLMRDCGTAICSASTVSYEYCCVGGLLFIIKTAENQSSIYDFLISESLALSFDNDFDNKILNPLSILEALLQKQAYYFDGSSATNLLKIFQHLTLHNNILIRKATLSDITLLYNWANDPEVRRYAYNAEPIKWDAHQKWFYQKIESANTYMYIFFVPDSVLEIPIAHIRFDIKEPEAIISYLIDRNYRGKGLGDFILVKGVERFLQENHTVKSIVGYVQHANVASCKSFERANFDLSPADQPIPYPDSRKYILKVK